MKLRIKGNSIRIRLTKTEVATICNTGYLEEQTNFGATKLVYALERTAKGTAFDAAFEDSKITVYIPETLTRNWADNDVVGFDARVPVNEVNELYLLVEKDFVCLDETTEDQSDNYENPNKSC